MTFDNFLLYESVKDTVYAKTVFREILTGIQKITPTIKRDNITLDESSKMYWTLEIRWLDIKCKDKIHNLLKQKQEELLKAGMVLSFKESEHSVLDMGKSGDPFDVYPTGEFELWYYIFIKDLYTKRYYPNGKFLFHRSSSKNRESITKNGLEPREFNTGNWTLESYHLYYPPTVFATPEIDGWHQGSDIWKINTKGLKNQWWEDLNFYRHEDPQKRPIRAVMTFDPIPPDRLKLIKI